MSRNLYTENEIILCTYLALYDTNAFSETEIHNKFNRPKSVEEQIGIGLKK